MTTTNPTPTQQDKTLECPLCSKPLTNLTNGLAYCHNLKTDPLSIDDWKARSCPLAQHSVQLPIAVWKALATRRAAVAGPRGGELLSQMWQALISETCINPASAKTVVFLGEEKFRKALAPFATTSVTASDTTRRAVAEAATAIDALLEERLSQEDYFAHVPPIQQMAEIIRGCLEKYSAGPADSDAESSGVGFCWVCRSSHQLIASECRAMDGVA